MTIQLQIDISHLLSDQLSRKISLPTANLPSHQFIASPLSDFLCEVLDYFWHSLFSLSDPITCTGAKGAVVCSASILLHPEKDHSEYGSWPWSTIC